MTMIQTPTPKPRRERPKAVKLTDAAAAPDLVMTVDREIAEADCVSVLWRGTGTNTGSGNGYNATGKRMTIRGITIWRIVDGRIVEEWSEFSAPVALP